jgi:hypothetical protein
LLCPITGREVMDGKEQPADYVKRIRWIFDDKAH